MNAVPDAATRVGRLGSRRGWGFRRFSLIALAVAMATAPVAVMADDFGPVHYDPKSDQLIITMLYSGTNPDHHFSTQWGSCGKLQQTGPLPAHPTARPPYETTLTIIDDQWNDAARKSYTTTISVPLTVLSSCRPARVWLLTSPVLDNDIPVDIP